MKNFEHMSAGKPIIASDLQVSHQILQNDQTALLCNPERIDTWIRAVQRLCNDATFREDLAKKDPVIPLLKSSPGKKGLNKF